MRIVVTGGGTGGHLFPGIALATGMQERIPGCRVLFIGTSRHLDRETLARYDFALETIHCLGLKGMGLLHRLRSLLQLPFAVREAAVILRRFRPQLVFGVGGYVTGPVLLAARVLGIPLCIHEQNSVPGLANRVVSRLADRIFLSIPCACPFPQHKTVLAGNPVRREIREAVGTRTPVSGGESRILILGGSQGAHRVNMLVTEAAGRVSEQLGGRVRFTHQTGRADLEEVRARYDRLRLQAEVKDFFADMAQVYSQADLVVSRAGATTLAELAVMGLPAILLPYPYAADNHQQSNGAYYEQGGAARMFREQDIDGEKLAGEILHLVENPETLHQMSGRMKELAKPDAAERIIDECLQLIERKRGRQA
ncbi:MAG TPA: undecaprenyldiphospho-muramoylpentapeptide beta-N-acetylglucosaminyltransferase [Desulfobulbaceae bacterium]|nr:undecaprenyldiphospho-muramoylpentapeptide beta-N-acetylglucosaminyltransferase [Desulfobulbaceae bacterium]